MNENKINSLNTIYDLMMSLYVQNVITALFFFFVGCLEQFGKGRSFVYILLWKKKLLQIRIRLEGAGILIIVYIFSM